MPMEFTHDDVKKILQIVDSAERLDEIDLTYGGFHLYISRSATPMAPHEPTRSAEPLFVESPSTTAPAPRVVVQPETLGAGEIAIRAPMLGTFYRSPTPDAPPFVEVGQRVHADSTLCLIEVMKLFSSITAGVDGVVKKIISNNGDLVEFDQVLIIIATGI